ncbi:MAG TPA: DUF262 domain-containing protein [Bacteroidales bacterium]|nr:DUF262 domain-containing protein [Bacteroidales bacterium]
MKEQENDFENEETETDDDGSLQEETKFEIKKYDISSYPADYTITTILEKYNKSIVVPEFQRKYVWGKDIVKQSRLIESLLLGLPVPQIFLFQKKDDKSLLLIDGFQRLHTIHRFFNNDLAMEGVQEPWVGKRYIDLSLEDKEAFDNMTIRAIIIRQITPSDNYSSMYQIFERLNTGGMFLSPMEIRKAIFYGTFYKNIEGFNNNEDWKKIVNRKTSETRLKDIEWLLRIIALYKIGVKNYQEPMKDYLTRFMEKNKDDDNQTIFDSLKLICEKIIMELGPKPFHVLSGRLNLALMDSVMVAILKNTDIVGLKDKYEQLMKYDEFIGIVKSRDATRSQNVKERIDLAQKIIY